MWRNSFPSPSDKSERETTVIFAVDGPLDAVGHGGRTPGVTPEGLGQAPEKPSVPTRPIGRPAKRKAPDATPVRREGPRARAQARDRNKRWRRWRLQPSLRAHGRCGIGDGDGRLHAGGGPRAWGFGGGH